MAAHVLPRALPSAEEIVQCSDGVIRPMAVMRSTRDVPSAEVVSLFDHQLKLAITNRRLIQFTYSSIERVAEPHDYGIQDGAVRLLVYQIRSRPFARGWRLLDVAKIRQFVVLEQTFAGSRRDAHPTQHYQWDTLFARVE